MYMYPTIIVVSHDTLKDKGLPPLSGHPPITDTLIWPEQCPLNGGTTVLPTVGRSFRSVCAREPVLWCEVVIYRLISSGWLTFWHIEYRRLQGRCLEFSGWWPRRIAKSLIDNVRLGLT